MNSRMSCEATAGLTLGGAQQGRGRFIRPKRASSANMIRNRRPCFAAVRLAFLTASAKLFFIVVLRLDVSVGMKGARHQLAPIVAVENVIDGAVTCRVPDRLLIRRLQIGDVQHLSSPGGFGKAIE